MKKQIIAIVGMSGAGKTTITDYIQKQHGIPQLESFTDRNKRSTDEGGHTFVTPAEFDQIPLEDMIAFTNFGDKRYCCRHSQVGEIQTYVIDPKGLYMLQNTFSHMYDVKALYIDRAREDRLKVAGRERVDRDPVAEFNMARTKADHVIYNSNNKGLDMIYYEVDRFLMHLGVDGPTHNLKW